MASQRLVSDLPFVFASLPPSTAPWCTSFVKGRLRATPHSSLRPTTAPFQTLCLDKSEGNSTLIRWLLATEDTPGSRYRCLHSDCGGEFRSDVLAGYCGEQGITQSWTLPESPQQNEGIPRPVFGPGPLVLGRPFESGAALRLSAIPLHTSSQLAPSLAPTLALRGLELEALLLRRLLHLPTVMTHITRLLVDVHTRSKRGRSRRSWTSRSNSMCSRSSSSSSGRNNNRSSNSSNRPFCSSCSHQ
ncbi:unnamed protein product [Closterium sp. NIES-54]